MYHGPSEQPITAPLHPPVGVISDLGLRPEVTPMLRLPCEDFGLIPCPRLRVSPTSSELQRKMKPVLILAFIAMAACSPAPVSAPSPAGAKAQESAQQWLSLIDAGKFTESWQEAAEIFQKGVSQAEWESAMETERKPIGDLISRKCRSVEPKESLPGAPAGSYMVIIFDASFMNQKVAAESLTAVLTPGGEWKVCGYYIK